MAKKYPAAFRASGGIDKTKYRVVSSRDKQRTGYLRVGQRWPQSARVIITYKGKRKWEVAQRNASWFDFILTYHPSRESAMKYALDYMKTSYFYN